VPEGVKIKGGENARSGGSGDLLLGKERFLDESANRGGPRPGISARLAGCDVWKRREGKLDSGGHRKQRISEEEDLSNNNNGREMRGGWKKRTDEMKRKDSNARPHVRISLPLRSKEKATRVSAIRLSGEKRAPVHKSKQGKQRR